jgi:hypothetical protein
MALRVTKAALVISPRSSYYPQASITSVERLLYKFPPRYLPMAQPRRSRKVLPSVMMRSGTSKGLFLHEKDLPKAVSEWGNILLSAMGSRDGDLRQLDGVGGATSTTSKVAVVSKSNMPGIDVEYTFVQIGVGSNKVDFSGNCGNICSGVGPFALDEGLVVPEPGQTEVRLLLLYPSGSELKSNNHRSMSIFSTSILLRRLSRGSRLAPTDCSVKMATTKSAESRVQLPRSKLPS